MTASIDDSPSRTGTSSEPQPLLRLERLSKSFTLHILRGKRVEAFRDVTLDVPEGGSLGVVGTSGSGKSSLLKAIYRTYLPSAGSVLYRTRDGRTLDLASADEQELLALRRAEIGYVTQFLRAQPRVPALDVVAAPRAASGVPIEQAREEARALLTRLRLPEEMWDSYPVLFSGGEQQRINLARGLITRPRLLLLDEPTSALDVENGATVLRLLQEARAGGTTLVSVFHDPAVVRAVCDQVALLHRGALLAVRPPHEIDLGAAFAA